MVKKGNRRLIFRLPNNLPQIIRTKFVQPIAQSGKLFAIVSGLFRTIHFAQYIPFVKGMY